MFKKVYTKRGVPNTADKQQASVFDFDEVEEEEERPRNTFKSGLDTDVFGSYCKSLYPRWEHLHSTGVWSLCSWLTLVSLVTAVSRKSGISGSSAYQRTGLSTQRTQFGRLQNENQASRVRLLC